MLSKVSSGQRVLASHHEGHIMQVALHWSQTKVKISFDIGPRENTASTLRRSRSSTVNANEEQQLWATRLSPMDDKQTQLWWWGGYLGENGLRGLFFLPLLKSDESLITIITCIFSTFFNVACLFPYYCHQPLIPYTSRKVINTLYSAGTEYTLQADAKIRCFT
jgi:hypothetical protein